MQRMNRICSLVVAAGLALTTAFSVAAPPEPAISYQGLLAENNTPVTGMRDFRFRLYDAAVGGSMVGEVELFSVEVADGLFSVELDFGVAPWEANEQRWVEIESGPADGTQTYEVIGRQKLSAVPYALNTRGISVSTAGNVGIGTNAGSRPLTVRGESSWMLGLEGPFNPGLRIASDSSASLGASWAIYQDSGSGDLLFRDTFDGTNRLAIDGVTGHIGIGTPVPARLLHLNDGLTVDSGNIQPSTDLLISSQDAGMSLVSDQSGSVGSFIDLMEQNGTGTLIDNWSMIRRTPAGGSGFEFRYGPNPGASTNSLVMSMLPNGHVGIGNITPQTTFETGGQIRVQSGGPNPKVGAGLEISFNPTAGAQLSSYNRGAGEPRNLRLNPFGGNVGVGTVSPETRLDVRYSEGNGLRVTDNNGTSSAIGVESVVGAGTGVRGQSTATSGSTFGVYGQVASAAGWGVYSNGRLGASGTKSFMIDHPLDPFNAYLLHYSSESPIPQNRYNGNVYLDGAGRGVVVLPDYFEAINTDHRYVLTPIGAPAPNLFVESEIRGNVFVIAGGVPGQKVSWEVISQRFDAFVQQRGAPVEVLKQGAERGKLLMPDLYGQPESMGIHFQPAPREN